MADLNTLLHWAIENTPAAQGVSGSGSGSGTAAPANPEGMQLTFKPAAPGQKPNASTLATFHPDDPQHDVGLAPPAAEEPKKDNKLSTEILDLIMGKPDSVTMKEKMAIASNTSADVDERVMALDDFEMLIELIDNANNMAVLKLWEPLLALINDPNEDIARHALWVAGTAIQNNLKGQAAFYIFGGLPLVLDALYPASGSKPSGTRAKAVYALSAALKHWPLATVALSAQDNRGYSVLRAGVADTDLVIRRKMNFMLGTIVNQARDAFNGEMPNEVRNLIEEQAKTSGAKPGSEGDELLLALQREGVFEAAVDALARDPRIDPEDAEYEENAIRALARAAEYGALSDEEKSQLQSVWAEWTPIGRAHRGIEGADAEAIDKALA
ncbi:hypothetical protein CC85DRAFT_289123 [Cutaneotrichosporon oleaginosum]|uniref:Nucleotide exchange factor Fes1 domain-containing protein n=1 Tax=Cutaneotrichosporon oleaginosum TaxID=879819 RepID=A0A0J0XCT0_9TREE|nr:uncharacterized protein CC85DRAFT_289123 [Cutaneotrichosporon oleaginosum]KLT38880.1 hypothetical protein CC85DRAFT_289123 [Cutaneotrichosporon oleaginosum]TXT14279.1 hypothetical protein COLE_00472 [Cutaneotrichosporon oleaginosum]